MKKIIYMSQNDAENFDMARFLKSVNRFAKISEKEAKEALSEFDQYETMHVSCLVEAGMKLIMAKKDEKAAKEYFEQYAKYFDEGQFERLRRITGYLVGTLSRWNDAKKAEEKARVKHSVNSAIDDNARLVALETQAMERNVAYATAA
ncbi:MAG: anaerobic ribonucleoside-triphosphate reductase [Candidatus Saccharibacteria bacterium]|nr:anaerobic ribonucleoside-triphosphate reductase [Candidatus Saccharibacteria bacterium]